MPDRLPTVASGARTTVAGIVSTRLKVDMGDLYKWESQGAALYTSVALLGKERAIAKTVSWHVSELRPKFARINGGITNGLTDTTFTVDSPMGNYVRPGFLIQFTRTGETCLTTTGGSATTIVVTGRSWGATAAATIVDNDEILIIGPAYAESASLQSAVSVTETQYSNYLHTMRHNWNIGGLLMELSKNGGTYNGDEAALQRKDILATHKRDINLAMLFSEGATSGGTATMTGLIPFINANAPGNVNNATVLTEPVFESGNKQWFRGGESGSRVLVCSRNFHAIASGFPKAQIRTSTGETKYGLRMEDYISAHGDVKLVREVALEGDEYDKYAVGFDPKMVKMKYARDTRLIKDRQGVSEDGYEEEVLTDFSAVWGHAETCYLWTDVAA